MQSQLPGIKRRNIEINKQVESPRSDLRELRIRKFHIACLKHQIPGVIFFSDNSFTLALQLSFLFEFILFTVHIAQEISKFYLLNFRIHVAFAFSNLEYY